MSLNSALFFQSINQGHGKYPPHNHYKRWHTHTQACDWIRRGFSITPIYYSCICLFNIVLMRSYCAHVWVEHFSIRICPRFVSSSLLISLFQALTHTDALKFELTDHTAGNNKCFSCGLCVWIMPSFTVPPNRQWLQRLSISSGCNLRAADEAHIAHFSDKQIATPWNKIAMHPSAFRYTH